MNRNILVFCVGLAACIVYVGVINLLPTNFALAILAGLDYVGAVAVFGGIIYGRGWIRAFCAGCALVGVFDNMIDPHGEFWILPPWAAGVYGFGLTDFPGGSVVGYREQIELMLGQQLCFMISGVAMVAYRGLFMQLSAALGSGCDAKGESFW